MAHVRQQIREAAAAAVTGLTTSGSRVFQSRVHPLDASKLPCLLVNTDEEEVTGMRISAPDYLDRSLVLTVRAVATGSSNLDDTLDTMISEVEVALGNTLLGGLVKRLGLESLAIEQDTVEKPVGIATMRYRAQYMTAANAPNSAV